MNTKLIFFILGGIIIIELFWAIKIFLTPLERPKEEQVIKMSSGQLILVSEKENFLAGDDVQVLIKVLTGGKPTDGLDLSLQFDPQIMEISDDFFQKGDIYTDYSNLETDSQGGLVRISATTSPEESFSGIGEFGRFKFKAKKTGLAVFKIDFQKGRTTDSNIIESGTSKDILNEVTDLEITIGGLSKKNDAKKDVCEGYIQICQNEKGESGTQQCFKGIMSGEICNFDPILTTSCTKCRVMKN